MGVRRFVFIVISAVVALATTAPATDPVPATQPKLDPRYPFRTDFANADLPWYKPVPGEFPPHHSDRRISGELVSADFYHRTGQFRASKTGELVDFTMPPYGSVNYLNTDADLRDVPLGTFFLFFLNQDSKGGFTRLATMQDQFTMDAGHGFSYTLDELTLGEGKLLTTKHKVAKPHSDAERTKFDSERARKELLVTSETRVWKGAKLLKLSDLAVGDELLFNLTGKTAQNPGRCTDIWIGAETHKLATERQRQTYTAFVKFRGLPAWVDAVDGDKLTVTLFTGDPGSFHETWMHDFTVGAELRAVVANDELRTWNPPTDGERAKLLEVKTGPVNCYGTSGVRLTFSVANMLEGFRKGRVVRVFGSAWPRKDPPYGEGLMNYGYSALKTAEIIELTPREYPAQFPFRTDYGNESLPWYHLTPGQTPPHYSEHNMLGELVRVDAGNRSGQFRTDRTGELVDFTLIGDAPPAHLKTSKPASKKPPVPADFAASVRYLNAEADLSELPLGSRCRFSLYQDEKGTFTRASLVTDEFSYLAQNAINYRIEWMKLDEGKLHVARQIPEVKNYNGDMEQPPDIGRTELLINADTRVWKGAHQVKLTDLAIGELLMVNLTSEQPGSPSHCTDIWVGPETHELATEEQQKKHAPGKK